MKKYSYLWRCLTLVTLAVTASGQQLQFLSTKASEDGSVQLKWRSQTNRLYRVEFVSTLAASNNWQTLEPLAKPL